MDPIYANKTCLVMRLLAPDLDGCSAPWRRMFAKKPLVRTPSRSQASVTGERFLCLAIQAYFDLKPARSKP